MLLVKPEWRWSGMQFKSELPEQWNNGRGEISSSFVFSSLARVWHDGRRLIRSVSGWGVALHSEQTWNFKRESFSVNPITVKKYASFQSCTSCFFTSQVIKLKIKERGCRGEACPGCVPPVHQLCFNKLTFDLRDEIRVASLQVSPGDLSGSQLISRW